MIFGIVPVQGGISLEKYRKSIDDVVKERIFADRPRLACPHHCLASPRLIWSTGPSDPLKFFSVINCSDGAAAPKESMTYGTTQRRSESDM